MLSFSLMKLFVRALNGCQAEICRASTEVTTPIGQLCVSQAARQEIVDASSFRTKQIYRDLCSQM